MVRLIEIRVAFALTFPEKRFPFFAAYLRTRTTKANHELSLEMLTANRA